MNNAQIWQALKTVKSFIGVFAFDELEKVKASYPLGLVVNTAKSNTPGEHWLSIWISESREGVLFNSFGYPPEKLRPFMDKYCTSWTYSNRLLQNPLSVTCGCYCVKFITDYSRTFSLPLFYKQFTYDTMSRDRYITAYINATYNLNIPIFPDTSLFNDYMKINQI